MPQLDRRGRVVLVGVVMLWLVSNGTGDQDRPRPKISGAYRELSFWGDSRAYPADDLGADAFMRGYEHAKATLRRPLTDGSGDPGHSYEAEAPAGA